MLSEVVTDDRNQSWFLVLPDVNGGSVVLCRLSGSAMTCGDVPTWSPTETHERSAVLLTPGPGATPLVAVKSGAGGARYLHPFTWTEISRRDDLRFDLDGIVWADGTLTLQDPGRAELLIVSPGQPPRAARWFDESSRPLSVYLSRFGAVWNEWVAPEQFAVMSASLDATGLGPARELARGTWTRVCQEGNTLGFLELAPDESEKSLVMIDVATGKLTRGDARGTSTVACRPGSVAAIAMRQDDRSTICDAKGCRSMVTTPQLENLNYHRVTLVEGSLLFVGTLMREQKLVTWRVGDQPPRTLRLAGNGTFADAVVRHVPTGAIALYSDGSLVAFDHQGLLRAIEFTWSGP